MVVIGILIALQLNTYKEQHAEKKKAREVVTGILNDLRQDTLAIHGCLVFFKREIDEGVRLLDLEADLKNVPVDSLLGLLPIQTCGCKINRQNYSKIANLGMSTLFLKNSLMDSITNYYTKNAFWLEKLLEAENDETFNDWRYWMKSEDYEFNISFENRLKTEYTSEVNTNLQNDVERKNAIIKRIKSIQGRNYIKMGVEDKLTAYHRLNLTKDYASKLAASLENYLE